MADAAAQDAVAEATLVGVVAGATLDGATSSAKSGATPEDAATDATFKAEATKTNNGNVEIGRALPETTGRGTRLTRVAKRRKLRR